MNKTAERQVLVLARELLLVDSLLAKVLVTNSSGLSALKEEVENYFHSRKMKVSQPKAESRPS
jgi:hypothetical protein